MHSLRFEFRVVYITTHQVSPYFGFQASTCGKGFEYADVDSNPGNYDLDMEDLSEDREELETWVEWIKRTTHQAEQHLENMRIENWMVKIRRQKWRCAQRHAILDHDRWSHVALIWNPLTHYTGSRPRGHRRAARPKVRWVDDITHFANLHNLGNWIQSAFDNKLWQRLESEFVKDDWR